MFVLSIVCIFIFQLCIPYNADVGRRPSMCPWKPEVSLFISFSDLCIGNEVDVLQCCAKFCIFHFTNNTLSITVTSYNVNENWFQCLNKVHVPE